MLSFIHDDFRTEEPSLVQPMANRRHKALVIFVVFKSVNRASVSLSSLFDSTFNGGDKSGKLDDMPGLTVTSRPGQSVYTQNKKKRNTCDTSYPLYYVVGL